MARRKTKFVDMYEHIAYDSDTPLIASLLCQNAIPDVPIFRITSVKRGRDGSIEIKLADRLVALDRLSEIDAGNHDTCNIYRALMQSAKSLNEED